MLVIDPNTIIAQAATGMDDGVLEEGRDAIDLSWKLGRKELSRALDFSCELRLYSTHQVHAHAWLVNVFQLRW